MSRLTVIKQNRYRVIFASILVVLLLIVLVSACDVIGIGGGSEPPPPSGPTTFGILAPTNNIKVLVNGPVQIQSAHKGDISRVELSVQAEGESETLIRADAPSNGVVVQEWVPKQTGRFTVKVLAYADGEAQSPATIQLEVIDSLAVSIAPVERKPDDSEAASISLPTTTPSPTPIPMFGIAQVAPTFIITPPTPTPMPRYPPPPPFPGVPPGPTQDQIPELMPPTGDAAKLVGVFASDNTRRVLITEPDDLAAKVVAGATVFRAWRVQNIGTNTWGPGYELAFYGGRAMGSGGVAFESTFPGEPARRNTVIDRNRLVVPEGKPNQTAIVEVMLNTPTIPGIHQSYWRMRNPQGVFFGPIMGVTMEVVRACEFNVYGAPVINRFEILGVGNVYQPVDPVIVNAEYGDNVTLDWDIINADNFDIVIEDPTGEVESVSTPDQRGRVTFPVNELGEYIVTLYADNGSCTVSAQVKIRVFPPEDNQFRLIIIHSGVTGAASSADANYMTSSSVSSNDIKVEWSYPDNAVDEFTLYSKIYEQKQNVETCLFGKEGVCYQTAGDWELIKTIEIPAGSKPADARMVTGLRSLLRSYMSDRDAEYQIKYVMEAKEKGDPTLLPCSNTVLGDQGSGFPSTEIPPSLASSGIPDSPCIEGSDSPIDNFIIKILGYPIGWMELALAGVVFLIFVWVIRLMFVK